MLFEYTDFSEVASSLVKRAYFNAKNGEMAVVLAGGTYVYQDVSYRTFSDLIEDISPGSYYNRNVKGAYKNKYNGGLYAVDFQPLEEDDEPVTASNTKVYTVRAFVPFEAQVEASSLDEAVRLFAESHNDVPGVTIKEVVVPFGE
ncbi:hypothetical protein SEA_BILLNYE_158 [Streptomyces phage BillNye]|uniref:KTSC domain-containing protein n=1 Tax=Streptomyces phage BillNye TaxID=2079426 RepID=A0A2L1IVX9_9CAUD|nr:hypothetical protein FDJ30_gp102 [Streptomyces phage BillNye]AVD99331.1 hypothetical protein SEA_BILLNYE_158 [Streptomyces phage BillNye]